MVDLLELFAVADETILSKSWGSADTPSSIWILIPLLGSLSITLWFNGPENWSHIFTLSRSRSIWKFFLLIHNTETLNDLNDCCLQVHGIEMQESASSIHKLLALLYTKINTEFSDFLII